MATTPAAATVVANKNQFGALSSFSEEIVSTATSAGRM